MPQPQLVSAFSSVTVARQQVEAALPEGSAFRFRTSILGLFPSEDPRAAIGVKDFENGLISASLESGAGKTFAAALEEAIPQARSFARATGYSVQAAWPELAP